MKIKEYFESDLNVDINNMTEDEANLLIIHIENLSKILKEKYNI